MTPPLFKEKLSLSWEMTIPTFSSFELVYNQIPVSGSLAIFLSFNSPETVMMAIHKPHNKKDSKLCRCRGTCIQQRPKH